MKTTLVIERDILGNIRGSILKENGEFIAHVWGKEISIEVVGVRYPLWRVIFYRLLCGRHVAEQSWVVTDKLLIEKGV